MTAIGIQHILDEEWDDLRQADSFLFSVGNPVTFLSDTNGLPSGTDILRLVSLMRSLGVFRKAFSAFVLNINATLDALERRGLVKTLAELTLGCAVG